MTHPTAGHLLVECLIAQGVTHAFGVPGESYLAVLDGFHAHTERIRFITNRQEGGAAFMAEAQGKLTGRPGVCFVTRGPGATNASIGLHTAFQDSTPLVLLSGSTLHNPDFCALARAYGYAAECITRTEEWEPALQRALAASTGTVLEVRLDLEVITTRGTLSAIRHNALRDRG